MFIVDFIISIMRSLPVFLGLIAFLGLVLQGKGISDVLKGTFKAIIGMVILLAGVDIVIGSINPLATGFNEIFAIEGDGLTGSFVDFLGTYGTEIGLIMLFAFIANVVIARFTPFKAIYLSGHLLFWFPMLFLAVGVEAGLSGIPLVIFATVFDIIVIVLSPFLLIKPVERVTGSREFTIAHTATPFILLGDFIGGKIGNKEKSTEDIKLPKALSFVSDTTITSGIVMWIVYLIVALFISADLRTQLYGDNWFVFALVQGMTFAAGMVVLLTGVRMFITEILEAFDGISKKLVPGAVPGLDIPLIFPYGPNALVLGFIISLATSIVTIYLLGTLGLLSIALVPLTIACYFDVAPGAIFANARGGRTAAIVTSVVGGFLLMVIAAVSIPLISGTAGDFLQAFGGNDFSIWTTISSLFSQLIP